MTLQTSAPLPFPLLDAHEALMHPLLQGHLQASERHLHHLALADRQQDQALRIWLKAALNKPGTQEEITALPAPQAARWQGWLAYHQGDYHGAWQHFRQGWQQAQAGQERPAGALPVALALGLGKVYTRTGHWHTARNWLLHALALARRGDRLFDCVRGYGALGELFLRAGHAQPALFCLGTAYHLHPPGASERSRQWNYLASALMRLGTERDQQAAQALLMSSFYLALDSHDPVSASHALARLQFRELDTRTLPRDIVHQLSAQQVLDALARAERPAAAVPQGFLAIGRAFAAWRRGDASGAQAHAMQARQHLRHNQAEHHWASALCQGLGITAMATDQIAEAPPVEITAAPSEPSVIDHLWQSLALTDLGAGHFAPPQNDIDTLLVHRKVFFL